MASIEDLKRILLLKGLPDQLLEKMLPFIELHQSNEREVIFDEGDKADHLYMVKRGKVLLEVGLSETIIISLGSVKSGYSFGWPALLGDANYTAYAVCDEPCEILTIPGARFLDILNQDHTAGYMIMERIFRILLRRLERRTGQFLKVLGKHPDIQKLLDLSE